MMTMNLETMGACDAFQVESACRGPAASTPQRPAPCRAGAPRSPPHRPARAANHCRLRAGPLCPTPRSCTTRACTPSRSTAISLCPPSTSWCAPACSGLLPATLTRAHAPRACQRRRCSQAPPRRATAPVRRATLGRCACAHVPQSPGLNHPPPPKKNTPGAQSRARHSKKHQPRAGHNVGLPEEREHLRGCGLLFATSRPAVLH